MVRAGLVFVTMQALAVDYVRDVRPILESRCTGCHGAKAKTHGLRLDRRADALKGGDSGAPAIVPGNSAASLAYRYLAGLDPDVRMPPTGPRLPDGEIAAIKAWIDSGASWPDDGAAVSVQPRGRNHWAFQPRTRPQVPAVKDKAWVRNSIDAFVLASLEAAGWKPAPASRAARSSARPTNSASRRWRIAAMCPISMPPCCI